MPAHAGEKRQGLRWGPGGAAPGQRAGKPFFKHFLQWVAVIGQMIAPMKFFQYSPLNISRIDASELAPVAACIDPDRPDVWSDIAERLYLVLKAQPLLARLAPEALAQAAVSQTYQLARDLGRDSLYLGIGNGMRARQLKRSIVAEFRGRNVGELVKKHGVTASRVRQILREHALSHSTS